MDSPPCNVIYVNRSVGRDGIVRAAPRSVLESPADGPSDWQSDQVRAQVQPLLDAFGDVHVCATGTACISRLFQLYDEYMTNLKPTLVLIDTPDDGRISRARSPSRSPSPSSPSPNAVADIHAPDDGLYGFSLLQKLVTEAQLRSVSKLVVPVPIVGALQSATTVANDHMIDGAVEHIAAPLSPAAMRRLMKKCLDLGAADVIISPLSSKCITSLEICAYRAQREASRDQQAMLEVRRGRKRSWVGVNDEKPYAYLREAMVSGLMNGICRVTDEDDPILSGHIAVSPERQAAIADAVGSWHFSAHAFTDDELVVVAMVMFQHAIAMPELETWRIPTDQLISFLVACRAAYNSFVPYHNFRHVVDVLQATFNFLVHIGALPSYPATKDASPPVEKSPTASVVTPFEALTLLITAIGHDVGHPGVNNGFLTTLNAPLAQLYNDRSVLESFHCAAYSQILRRCWPAAFNDSNMRSLMISSILATDMGLHFEYMKKLGDLQDKLHENNSTDGWNGRQKEEHRALACALLIKCADISNVARNHDTALQWMYILSEEFSRQASMESELNIHSSLMAPPTKDLVSLSKSQLGFMNLFAIPLFQGVADVMPEMTYTVDELEINKNIFEEKVREEKDKQTAIDSARKRLLKEGTFSPRTMSFAVAPGEVDQDSAPHDRPGRTMGDVAEDIGMAPIVMEGSGPLDEGGLSPPATMKPSHVPSTDQEYKEINGTVPKMEPSSELADGQLLDYQDRMGSSAESSSTPPSGRQRCSETTEGSASGAGAGDWASQATSVTTGKIPLCPSTQGTSIVSNESTERYGGSLGKTMMASFTHDAASGPRSDGGLGDGESTSTGSMGKAEGKSLKKRPSRFRMRDFPFFRRHHKESSPPLPTSDPTG